MKRIKLYIINSNTHAMSRNSKTMILWLWYWFWRRLSQRKIAPI